jgi:hypothetical protein
LLLCPLPQKLASTALEGCPFLGERENADGELIARQCCRQETAYFLEGHDGVQKHYGAHSEFGIGEADHDGIQDSRESKKVRLDLGGLNIFSS